MSLDRSQFKGALSGASTKLQTSKTKVLSMLSFDGEFVENNILESLKAVKAPAQNPTDYIINYDGIFENENINILILLEEKYSDKNIILNINKSQNNQIDEILDNLEESVGVYQNNNQQ